MNDILLKNIPSFLKEIFQDLHGLTKDKRFLKLAEWTDYMPATVSKIIQFVDSYVTADPEVERRLEIARSLLDKYILALGISLYWQEIYAEIEKQLKG